MPTLIHSVRMLFREHPIPQTIGFFALLVNAIAFATSKDKKFLIFMAISSGIWGVHFAMMGMVAGAGVSFLDIFKNLLALKYPKHQAIFWGLLLLYLCIGFLTFEGGNWMSVIPSINAILALIFVFYLQGKALKVWFLLVLVLRFYYNRAGGSLWGMISDISLFCSGLYGLWKLVKGK